MKKYLKKVLSLLLALTLVLSVTSVTQVSAAVPARTVTLYSKSSKTYNGFWGTYASANQPILSVVPNSQKITGLKSSNPSVATLFTKKGSGQAKGSTCIFLNLKKSGTTTISYKAEKKVFTTKFIVKKYTSPISSLKLGSLNLSSKFKSNNIYTLSYTKYKNKSLKLNYKAKTGWDVSIDYMRKLGDMKADMIKNNKSFKVVEKNSLLIINAYTPKTRQLEQDLIIFK